MCMPVTHASVFGCLLFRFMSFVLLDSSLPMLNTNMHKLTHWSFQTPKDSIYLERVRRLESEMERVSSGLALVSQVRFSGLWNDSLQSKRFLVAFFGVLVDAVAVGCFLAICVHQGVRSLVV